MCWKKIIFTLSLILLLALASCNLPGGTRIAGDSGDLPGQPTRTVGTPGALQPIETSSQTPSITSSLTPELPLVTVSVATNCRTGPGEPYDIIGALPVGIPAEVVGRNASGDTWIIKLPSNPSITCWLWGHYATVTGDTSHLPIVEPPPTPTPVISPTLAPGFSFVYTFWGVGPGLQCPWFTVTNNGGTAWESYKLTFKNITDGGSWTSQSDKFVDLDNWCATGVVQLNLDPGEVGTASVTTFMLHSAGDTMEVTLTVCSGNALTGYCMTKTITFTGL